MTIRARFLRPLLLLRLSAALAVGPAMAAELSVEVSGHLPSGGKVRVALFSDSETFLKKPLRGVEVDPASGPVVAIFKDLPPGTYALSAYHDANDNNKLDRGLFNIPVERYGFSRDARGDGGPPEFRDAQIEVQAPATRTSLKLR